MTVFAFLVASFVALFVLAMARAPLIIWSVAAAAIALVATSGMLSGGSFAPALNGVTLFALLPAIMLGLFSIPPVRMAMLTAPVFAIVKRILPPVSETEQEALDAGTVGWDAELFSGKPDWNVLKNIAPLELSEEERAFLDGPTEELCRMLDDWSIRHDNKDIPEDALAFMAEKGFFGMLISKENGGLGFSPQAQSLIVGKVSSRSPDAATVVAVPNSLGPGELIEHYGTDAQKAHYLPRLAQGKEVPCFALTGPTSGSDAATMRDIGYVAKGTYNSEEVLGVRVSWDKRYITLAPKATLLGLAFRLFDPEALLGDKEDIGITLAMIPTTHPGVNIGRRHLPSGSAFPNGPNWGKDVFIPMEFIIGGQERVGQGWRMLMNCLSVGRAISLPASSTAGAKAMLRHTTAYTRIRKQFGMPIGRMEGIEEVISRLVESAYLTEAGRSITASMVAGGEKPAVPSAVMKYQSTEYLRRSVNDAMDIHGGRAICDGPSNYLQGSYQMVPVGITVEGANILTRTLITFAQGSLRCHPYLLAEISAAEMEKHSEGLKAFDAAFRGHVSFVFSNMAGATFHNLTGGMLTSTPSGSAVTQAHYKQLARATRTFALIADLTVSLLGGGLKMKQRITGRLADALSEIYLISSMLKRFEDDGKPREDLDTLRYCVENALCRFDRAIDGVIANFPIKPLRPVMRVMAFPLGMRRKMASDDLGKKIVAQVLEPGEFRDRLTRDIFISHDRDDFMGILEHTLQKVIAAEPVERKLERAVRKGEVRRFHGIDWLADAQEVGVLTEEEVAQLRELEQLVGKVIAVDHFDPEAVVPNFRSDEETVRSFGLAAE
ncbi:MAG: acyl-CoA dehydrogenase [Pseudomonadota bacterium]